MVNSTGLTFPCGWPVREPSAGGEGPGGHGGVRVREPHPGGGAESGLCPGRLGP